MADRIWVGQYNGNPDLILLQSGEEVGDTPDQVFNVAQAKQLVIDLNKLIAGEIPDDVAEVEGIED